MRALSHKDFRRLWVSGLVSNIGTWMHEVGEAWLMTTLTPSALLVSLVQGADALPVLLLALPAGALADIVDRRKLLIFTQSWMMCAAALLGFLTVSGLTTPGILLACTFVLGVGSAINIPVWQAALPELVPNEDLPDAVMLQGIGMNAARVAGPALGGLLVAAVGAGWVFLINAGSFLVVIAAIVAWRRAAAARPAAPAERIMGAMAAGVRFVRHSPGLRAVYTRTLLFAVPASALWSLLPVLAKRELGEGAAGYGLLIGCVGLGAVSGAPLISKVRSKHGSEATVLAGTAVFAAGLAALAWAPGAYTAGFALLFVGASWIAMMATLNYSAQASSPSWVRGRAMACYVMTFQGGFAAGSLIWGSCAQRFGARAAIGAAAAVMVAGLPAALKLRLPDGPAVDLRPSDHWRAPDVAAPVEPDEGPVVVTVEYRVKADQAPEFVRRMDARRLARRRDGAYDWGLYRDAADPNLWVEIFVVESWAEHLRQHGRATVHDKLQEAEITALHEPNTVVRHLIAAR